MSNNYDLLILYTYFGKSNLNLRVLGTINIMPEDYYAPNDESFFESALQVRLNAYVTLIDLH